VQAKKSDENAERRAAALLKGAREKLRQRKRRPPQTREQRKAAMLKAETALTPSLNLTVRTDSAEVCFSMLVIDCTIPRSTLIS